MFGGNIIVYKFIEDLHFFVTGDVEENELILLTVLQCFSDAVALLLRYFPHLIFKQLHFDFRQNLNISYFCPGTSSTK